MTDERIREVMESFASQAKSVYGTKLHQIVLYGSCARGDYQQDSDIDVMLLLNVGQDQLAEERKKVFDIADEIDLKYDVVLEQILEHDEDPPEEYLDDLMPWSDKIPEYCRKTEFKYE